MKVTDTTQVAPLPLPLAEPGTAHLDSAVPVVSQFQAALDVTTLVREPLLIASELLGKCVDCDFAADVYAFTFTLVAVVFQESAQRCTAPRGAECLDAPWTTVARCWTAVGRMPLGAGSRRGRAPLESEGGRHEFGHSPSIGQSFTWCSKSLEHGAKAVIPTKGFKCGIHSLSVCPGTIAFITVCQWAKR
jgi:hypothetical protein